MIVKQYNYLKSCINTKGQLVDKKLQAPLNFQYHYSSFILSSILRKDYENLNKVLNYYFSIPTNIMKPSNDFNIVLILFAVLNDEDNILDKYKSKIIESITHNTDEELFKLNNNFRALRLLGMILESKVKESAYSQKIYDEIDWILELQFDDGFFPDSNMKYEIHKNQGVPHLTYHAKIMMCVGFSYLYTKDARLKESFLKAMKVLLDISIDNYYFFYGRSTNALFGYGSLYISLILAYKFTNDKMYLNKANDMKIFIENFQHTDGHISINLNKDGNQRWGFDTYMYDIVYNAYSNALFLLGDNMIVDSEKNNIKQLAIAKENIQIHKNSGFVVYKSKDIKYCLNFKGHQNSLKHGFDSRVSPFSILYFQNNITNLLPAIGYKPSGILSLVETKFYFKKIYAKLYQAYYYDWLPIFSGNSFFYTRDSIKFYPFKCIKMLKLENTIIMKFESKSRAIVFNKNKTDYFVVSIKLTESPIYKILFYEKVDEFYYVYREIENEINFDYTFSHKYNKLKIICIETSNKKADLHRYRFNDLKQLEIKVNILNEQ